MFRVVMVVMPVSIVMLVFRIDCVDDGILRSSILRRLRAVVANIQN